MDLALLGARLLLSAVFLIAGVSKLYDRAGSRQTVIDFGGPARVAGFLAVLIPVVEILTALALIPVGSAWVGAAAASVLLALFTAAMAVSLARGRRPACRCFGRINAAPIGWRTIARNSVLIAVAGCVVASGRDDAGLSVSNLAGSVTGQQFSIGCQILLVILASLIVWLLLQLTAQNGRLLLRVEAFEAPFGPDQPQLPPAGLTVGTPAPDFQLPSVDGNIETRSSLTANREAVLLVFSDPNCGPCNALLPEVARWQRELSDVTVAVISRGTEEANRAKSEQHGLLRVLMQREDEVSKLYQAHGTPSAVLIGSDGLIRSPLAQGAEHIQILVSNTQSTGSPASAGAWREPIGAQLGRQNAEIVVRLNTLEQILKELVIPQRSARAPAQPTGLPVRAEAPAFELPVLNGGRKKLADFLGRKILLIFFNPRCGFCEQMAPALAALPFDGENGGITPVVITTGDVGQNRKFMKKHGIRCPVLRQEGMEIASLYATGGTPTGYLIDEEGRIVTELAIGAEALLTLASVVGKPLRQMPHQLTEHAPAPHIPPPSLPVGSAAPEFELPEVNGGRMKLTQFRGRKVLLIFFNPQCGFCDAMARDLAALSSDTASDGPEPVVVTTGSVQMNRKLIKAHGIRCPVLLQQEMEIANLYATGGTPTGYLIDEEGKIASPLTMGADALLAVAWQNGARESGRHSPSMVSGNGHAPAVHV